MKRKLLMMLFFILSLSLQSLAQGNLLVTPTRVVFEGNKQKEELNLVNIGRDTAIYSISFVQYNQKEDGRYEIIEKSDPGQMSAEPYLRIFPRMVTLAPGEAQVIALQCRRKEDMTAGEYRSHLYFRSEKKYKPLGVENSDKDTTALSVQLIPIFGISIPIIIRSGVVNVSAILSDLKLETLQDTIINLKLTINRTGNISINGNLIVEYVPTEGKSYQVGLVKGLGVYTSINKRNVVIRLTKTPGMTYNNGKLKVSFSSADDAVKKEVYSVSELELH